MSASRLSLLAFGAALFIPAAPSLSHGLWLEPGAGGCKVFFGEPEHGLREKQDKLGRFLTLKAWKADGAESKPELKEDHIFFAAGGDCTAANLDSPVREPKEAMGGPAGGPVKGFQYLRFAANLAVAGKPAPSLHVDLVPAGDGTTRFTALKGGKPFESAPVEVIAPNGWSRQVEAGKDGKVEVPAPWPGLYIVKVSWKDRTPGEFKGKKYGTASHNLAVSFVKP